MKIKNKLLAIILILSGATLAFGVYCALPHNEKNSSLLELFKFFLFTCASGGVLFLYKSIQAEQALEAASKEFVRSFKLQLVNAYSDLKKVRRMMRVDSSSKKDPATLLFNSRIGQHLNHLNDVQLEIELLRRTVEANPKNFHNLSETMADLSTLDNYLRSVLMEFETHDFVENKSYPNSQFPSCFEFLYSHNKPHYVDAFNSLNTALLEYLDEEIKTSQT